MQPLGALYLAIPLWCPVETMTCICRIILAVDHKQEISIMKLTNELYWSQEASYLATKLCPFWKELVTPEFNFAYLSQQGRLKISTVIKLRFGTYFYFNWRQVSLTGLFCKFSQELDLFCLTRFVWNFRASGRFAWSNYPKLQSKPWLCWLSEVPTFSFIIDGCLI